jgi:hypothetical protein
MKPGQTAVTPIPKGASSAWRASDRPRIANFGAGDERRAAVEVPDVHRSGLEGRRLVHFFEPGPDPADFQDRRLRPLGHLSARGIDVF